MLNSLRHYCAWVLVSFLSTSFLIGILSNLYAQENTDLSHGNVPIPSQDLALGGADSCLVFSTGVGPSFQQALSGRDGSGLVYQRFVFNPGIRLDLEPGYDLFPWLRLGGEASFLYNSLDSVQYNNLILHGAGGFYQVPLMGTVRGTWPTEGPIRGHAVGGFGGVCDILTVGNEIARQVGRSSYYSYTWNYVCEVGAGVSFEIMPDMDLELDYKLLCTPIPNIAESGTGESSFNHAIEIGLDWRF